MRLWLVSPAWRRYEVTRLALAQRAHLQGVLAGRGIDTRCVVVADDENLDVAAEYGFDALERPNEPLGRKFNDGIEWACLEGAADFVCVIGSDDWVHESVFDRLPETNPEPPAPTEDNPVVSWSDEPEALAGTVIAVVDVQSGRGRLRWWPRREGVIPWVFPRAALEPSGFRPVKDNAARGIDGSLVAGLGIRPQWLFHDPHEYARVDFKSDVNLNTYAEIGATSGVGDEHDAWGRLSELYPEPLVEMAQRVAG